MVLLMSASSIARTLLGDTSRASAVEPGSLRAAELVSRVLGHLESARVIGAEYLRARPGQADVSALLQDVFPIATGDAHGLPRTARDFRFAFHERMRSDFECGRVVSVAGWVLSETEAKLCAIATLS